MHNTLSAAHAGTVSLGGDLRVNRLGLGTNRITDTPQARSVLLAAVELGVNFIDTADIYTQHQSEEMIAKTLAPYNDGLVVATKGGMMVTDHSSNNDPAYLRGALEASLQRLKSKTIDLYQLHRIDPKVPFESTVKLLRGLQEEGKIRQIGLSEATVEQIERAMKITPIASVQNQYNMWERKYEDVLDYCEAHGIVFIPWYPIAKGKVQSESVTRLSKHYNATPVQLSIAWLLKRSPVMLPIPGTLSVEHLRENVASAEISLSDEHFEELSGLAKGGK